MTPGRYAPKSSGGRRACAISSSFTTTFWSTNGTRFPVTLSSYASLYFAAIVDKEDNGFLTLEVLHHFVEVLDRYFGNVCELDLIFNFHKAYQVLDELIICGYVHEPSKGAQLIIRDLGKKQALKVIATEDEALEESKEDDAKK